MNAINLRQQLRDEVTAAWHGPLTAQQIVKKFSRRFARLFDKMFTVDRLRAIWAEAKDSAGLPPHLPRPHFVEFTTSQRIPPCAAGDATVEPADEDDACDDRDSDYVFTDYAEKAFAALMGAHHPDGFTALPEPIIKAESARGMPVPSPHHLRELARALDAQGAREPNDLARVVVFQNRSGPRGGWYAVGRKSQRAVGPFPSFEAMTAQVRRVRRRAIATARSR